MMVALFSDGVTYSTGRPTVLYFSTTAPVTGETMATPGAGGYARWGPPTTVAATTVTIEMPIDPFVLALRKAIARRPRSRAGRLCHFARDGRIAYAACWNRQESTPPARTFHAEATYKARVVAELQRVRAKRG